MAVDLNLESNMPFYLLAVLTSGVKKVKLPPNAEVTIGHTAIQDDGSTASDTTDYVVVMHQSTAMAANAAAGRKMLINAYGGNGTVRGHTILTGDDEENEIHLQAVGNGAMVQFLAIPRAPGV